MAARADEYDLRLQPTIIMSDSAAAYDRFIHNVNKSKPSLQSSQLHAQCLPPVKGTARACIVRGLGAGRIAYWLQGCGLQSRTCGLFS